MTANLGSGAEGGQGPQWAVLTMRFASCGLADARDRAGRDEPGLRYGAGWRVSGRERPCGSRSVSSVRLGSFKRRRPLGWILPAPQAGGVWPTTAVYGCWRFLDRRLGFGSAAGPSKPRMVDPSTGLRLRGAVLAWSMGQGCRGEFGGELRRGSTGGLGSGIRVPAATLQISPRHGWDRSPQPSSPASVCAGSRPGADGRDPRFAVRARKRARHDGRSASGSNGTVKLQEQLPHHCRSQGCSHRLAQPGRTAPRWTSRASGPAIPRLV